jgi:hypothetical protein
VIILLRVFSLSDFVSNFYMVKDFHHMPPMPPIGAPPMPKYWGVAAAEAA